MKSTSLTVLLVGFLVTGALKLPSLSHTCAHRFRPLQAVGVMSSMFSSVNTNHQTHQVASHVKNNFRDTFYFKYSEMAREALMKSPLVNFLTSYWLLVPPVLRQLLGGMHPADFIFLMFFNLLYKRSLKLAHKAQVWVFKCLQRSPPYEYDKSILGFVEKRSRTFVQLLVFNYIAKLSCSLLIELGLRIRPDLPDILVSRMVGWSVGQSAPSGCLDR